MLDAQEFLADLTRHGISFYSGVPCSFLTEPLHELTLRPDYIGASIETESLSLAAGAWLAGKQAAVFCQNSGLGNLISPLSSLNAPFAIPALLVLGWRGAPGVADEPQHMLMGQTTRDMLALMGVTSMVLPTDWPTAKKVVSEAVTTMTATHKPVALLVRPKTFAPREHKAVSLPSVKTGGIPIPVVSDHRLGGTPPKRYDVLENLVKIMPANTAVVATTGKCGRELYTIGDESRNFYMVGSMGSASAIGLGIALNSERPVTVLDGDGAALMRLGTMATIGRTQAKNLTHIILDNQAHDSTGGQPTGSETVDFAAIAAACGYATAMRCDRLDTFLGQYQALQNQAGPHLIHMRIQPGSLSGLARPDTAPQDVARRFRQFCL